MRGSRWGLLISKMTSQPRVLKFSQLMDWYRFGSRPSAGKTVLHIFPKTLAIFDVWKPPSVPLRQPLKFKGNDNETHPWPRFYVGYFRIVLSTTTVASYCFYNRGLSSPFKTNIKKQALVVSSSTALYISCRFPQHNTGLKGNVHTESLESL